MTGSSQVRSSAETLARLAIPLLLVGVMHSGCKDSKSRSDKASGQQEAKASNNELEYHGEKLVLEDAHLSEIHFEHINIRLPLPKNHYFRSFGAVESLSQQLRELLRKYGLEDSAVVEENTAQAGMHLPLRFKDGRFCSYVWVRRDDDARITAARLAHEKCHAAATHGGAVVDKLHSVLSTMAPRVKWQEIDEELRCTIIELMSLRSQDISLASLEDTPMVKAAKDALAVKAAPAE